MQRLVTVHSVEQTLRKSRFRAICGPVDSEEDARAFLRAHADPAANHNCYAFSIGPLQRAVDDGEPSGTAGRPILSAIVGEELDCAIVLVTRWFGGVLLGSGGLVRAYGGTAAEALRAAPKELFLVREKIICRCALSDRDRLLARLKRVPDLLIDGEIFDGDRVILTLALPQSRRAEILTLIGDVTRGQAEVTSPDP